ncbi:MAG: hypothetical protein AAGJ46_21550, partial [Planctomycetota bacterium]
MIALQQLINEAAETTGVFDGQGEHFLCPEPVYIPGSIEVRNCTIENTAPEGSNPRLCQPVYIGSFAVQDLERVKWHREPLPKVEANGVYAWRTEGSYDVNGHKTPERLRLRDFVGSNPFAPPRGLVADLTAGRIGATPGLPSVPLGFVQNVALIDVGLIASGDGFGLGRCGVVGFYSENLYIKASNPGPSNGIVNGRMVNTYGECERCAFEAKIGCQNLEIDGWNFRAYGASSDKGNLPAVTLGQSCEGVHVRNLAVNANGAGF